MSPITTTSDELQARIDQLERELTETRSQLQQIFEYIPLSTAMLDTEMRYLRVNQMWIDDYRLHEQEFAGKSHYDIFPEISEERRALHQRCLAGEVSVSDRHRFVRADGRMDWVQGTVRPWFQTDGQIGGLLMYTTIITPRLEAEEKLRNSESRYRSLVENNPDFIMTVNRENIVQFVNWLASDMTADQIIGKNALDFVPPELAETARATHLAVLNGAEPTSYETMGPGPGGSPRWYETRVQPIHEHNEIVGLTLIATDITERKRIRDALYESESNAQSLLRLAKALETATTNEAVVRAVHDEVALRIGYQHVWFYLMQADGKSALLIDGQGEFFARVPDRLRVLKIEGDPFLVSVFAANQPVIVEDALNDPRVSTKIMALTGNRTIINIPVLLADRRLGVLGTGSFGDEGVRVPTQNQLDYLQALASQIAPVLDRIRFLEAREQSEVALRQSELNYREAQRIAQLGNFEFDFQKQRVTWSDEVYRFFEVEIGTPVTLALYESLMPPAEFARVMAAVDQAIETGEPYEMEHEVVLADGTCKQIFAIGRPVKDAAGQVVRIFGIAQDITARKQAEAALRRSENRYRTLVENLPDVALSLLDTDLRLIFSGGSELENLRRVKDQLAGKDLSEWFAADNAEFSLELMQQVLEGETIQFETVVEDYTYLTSYIPILDTRGQIENIMGLSQNITERKRTEQTLQEQRDFLQKVIDLMPGVIVVKDTAGRFMLANQHMADIYGTAKANLYGRGDADFGMTMERVEHISRVERDVMRSGQTLVIPEDYIEGRYYQVTIIPLQNAAGIHDRVLMVVFDITGRRVAEIEREKLIDELTIFHTLAEAATSGIVMANPQGIITYANPAFYEMHGYDYQNQEVIGTL
ncbi:MAG: PAS domain-containing protein, partial [Anaerolineae bacterium]|nr:PAS domain-containing protein [Anaerolineae bacterium]